MDIQRLPSVSLADQIIGLEEAVAMTQEILGLNRREAKLELLKALQAGKLTAFFPEKTENIPEQVAWAVAWLREQ